VKYNLRNKIIAGLDINTIGKRRLMVYEPDLIQPPTSYYFEEPVHLNINLNAEYRYNKNLSFWLRLNNISFNRYYEWAYYPSYRFLGLVGFTYSL